MWLLALLLLADTSRAFSIALAPAESVRVTVGGAGDPVVLIPGLFGSAFGYRSVLPRLVDAGYRTIVIEPLGIGASARPEHADYSLTAQADRVAAALDLLGVSDAIVIAHSVGAAIAYRLAYRRPNLVRGIVSLDGGPAEAATTRGFRRAIQLAPWIKLFGGERLVRARVRRGLIAASGDTTWVTDQVVEGYTAGAARDLAGTLKAYLAMARAHESGRPAARTRAGRWALSWCARPRRGSHLHRSGARCVGDRSRAPGAPGPDAAPRAGAAARRDARDSERRLHPRVSRRGGRQRRSRAVRRAHPSLQPDRPGPPRAVSPDFAPVTRGRTRDRRRTAAGPPVRVAAAPRRARRRERDGREPHSGYLPRGAGAARDGFHADGPALALVPRVALADGRRLPGGGQVLRAPAGALAALLRGEPGRAGENRRLGWPHARPRTADRVRRRDGGAGHLPGRADRRLGGAHPLRPDQSPVRLDATRRPHRSGPPLPRDRLLRQSYRPGGPGRRDGSRGRAVRARPWRRVATRRPLGLAVSAGLPPLHAAERRARDADGGRHADEAADARARRGPRASLGPRRSSSSTSAGPSMPMACIGARASTRRTGRPAARSAMRRSSRSTNGRMRHWPGRPTSAASASGR